MALHESIKASIPDAMRAKDEVKLRTLRSLASAMTNEVVAKKRKPDEFLTDEEAQTVLKRAANQRKDSIEQFEKAGRTDLSEPEKAELAIIESLLPAQMPREEIEKIARARMAEMGVSSKAEAGKFTGVLMKELKGQADGGDVKAVVDSLLS
ncbi:MAG TPA: GatB/YqeY domain-containing protein [Candidatus Paceibacterota bacterium]